MYIFLLFSVCNNFQLSNKKWHFYNFFPVLSLTTHMRRFPEPQIFLLQHDKIRILESGFEASKFLHKCEPPLWSIVNCCKLTIYDWPLRTSTFTKKFGSCGIPVVDQSWWILVVDPGIPKWWILMYPGGFTRGKSGGSTWWILVDQSAILIYSISK